MGITLKASRVNAGLTQKQASERLGVTSVTLGSWEKGKTFPKAWQLTKIADLYGVRIDDIIF